MVTGGIYFVEYKASRRLIMYICDIDNKVVAINLGKVIDSEVVIIKSSYSEIALMEASELVCWFKKNVPISFNVAFRTYLKDELSVISQHSLLKNN